MSASKKIQASIEGSSWIRKMFEEGNIRKQKYGAENVFDFSLGNPNLEPPAKFKQVLKELANDPEQGQHGYMPNAGFETTRKAVADYLSGYNRPIFSADDVVMTVGAGGGWRDTGDDPHATSHPRGAGTGSVPGESAVLPLDVRLDRSS